MKTQAESFLRHTTAIVVIFLTVCLIKPPSQAAGLSPSAEKYSEISASKKTPKKPLKKKTETKLTVYYFHGYARCASCRKIEQYTKEAVEQNFSSGTYSGRARFAAVNIEEAANEHFVNDYQLVSKAVILQPEKDGKPGKWENLDRIWLELGDKDKFIAYIKGNIIKQLEAN